MNTLRFDIIPTLDSAGLITRDKDKEDNRKEIIFIVEFKSVGEVENNSDKGGGENVENELQNSDGESGAGSNSEEF